MKNKLIDEIIKKAKIEWGLKIGQKSTQKLQEDVLVGIVINAYNLAIKDCDKKYISLQINAFNPPTNDELGAEIKELLKKRTIREPYWEGSSLSSDNLYLRVHES